MCLFGDLPPLEEIHIVKLVQLYGKLKCPLYFRHDIIPLITCQKERDRETEAVSVTEEANHNGRVFSWARRELLVSPLCLSEQRKQPRRVAVPRKCRLINALL